MGVPIYYNNCFALFTFLVLNYDIPASFCLWLSLHLLLQYICWIIYERYYIYSCIKFVEHYCVVWRYKNTYTMVNGQTIFGKSINVWLHRDSQKMINSDQCFCLRTTKWSPICRLVYQKLNWLGKYLLNWQFNQGFATFFYYHLLFILFTFPSPSQCRCLFFMDDTISVYNYVCRMVCRKNLALKICKYTISVLRRYFYPYSGASQ